MELKAFSIVLIFLLLTTCANNTKESQKTDNTPVSKKEVVKTTKVNTTPISTKEVIADKISESYAIPKALDINANLTKKCKGTFDCRIEPFYPIGWSATGNFAYIIEPDTEAAGAYVFQIFVRDTTNKILWQWEFSQLDQENWDDESIETIWKRNSKLFTQKLNAYSIIQDTTLLIKELPLSLDGKIFQTKLKEDTQENELFTIEEVSKIKISFNTNNDTLKTVYTHRFNKNEMIIHTEVVGILVSQDATYYALLYTSTRRGWEGPPHIIAVQPILGNFE